MAIMEYAYILLMRRITNSYDANKTKSVQKPNKYTMKQESNASKSPEVVTESSPLYPEANTELDLVSHCNKVDKNASIVSLLLFILFNAIYWAKYLSFMHIPRLI